MPVIKMDCINAEMQHEIDAVETELKWRRLCKKWREDGTNHERKDTKG